MTHLTLFTAAIIFLCLPTVAYGGYFLAGILRKKKMGVNFSEYPYAQRLFRAGHAHAGVWLTLSLVALVFIQACSLSSVWQAILRYTFPLSAIVISGGFFAGAFPLNKTRTKPGKGFMLVYFGALTFSAACFLLAYGLFKT